MLVTKAIGLAKKVKKKLKETIVSRQPVYLSPVRRIERVAVRERVAAMTFDDGPCRLPANIDGDDRALTLRLVETLEKYGAKGTFDVVGTTAGNYPDIQGDTGSVNWSGCAYDHYPDFEKDADGGVVACPELTARILAGGHEITSHTYRHVLFGPKPLVYGKRRPYDTLEEVSQDLKALHAHMQSQFGYTIRLSRPPHYVDRTKDGFSAYDAYAKMGYQYLGASFDGAGWLPLATVEDEVQAMVTPLKAALEQDADALCGQIIFQKDGYNMARRAPVAEGLDRQLALLREYGYEVVTVSELMERCPFTDVSPEDELFADAVKVLNAGFCIAFRDNTLRPEAALTRGETAMMLYGMRTARRRIEMMKEKHAPAGDVSCRHAYSAAVEAAVQSGAMELSGRHFRPNDRVTPAEAQKALSAYFCTDAPIPESMTHAAFIHVLAKCCDV